MTSSSLPDILDGTMMLSLSMVQGGLDVAGFSSQGPTMLSTGGATSPAHKLSAMPNVIRSMPAFELFTMNYPFSGRYF